MIFGTVLLVLAVLVLAYYIYRQVTDEGYNMFPDNFIPGMMLKHPELFACEAAAKVSHVAAEEE